MLILGLVLLVLGFLLFHPLVIVGVVLLIIGAIYELAYVQRGSGRRRYF